MKDRNGNGSIHFWPGVLERTMKHLESLFFQFINRSEVGPPILIGTVNGGFSMFCILLDYWELDQSFYEFVDEMSVYKKLICFSVQRDPYLWSIESGGFLLAQS